MFTIRFGVPYDFTGIDDLSLPLEAVRVTKRGHRSCGHKHTSRAAAKRCVRSTASGEEFNEPDDARVYVRTVQVEGMPHVP
jgi:hypothetical protein